MNSSEIAYLTFALVVVAALVFDLGLFSRKAKIISIKTALLQTIFWVSLALCFFVFLWFENGHRMALEYLSAYLMEWSLSIDNIFVFILIFTYFGVKKVYYARVLLIGILLAIFLRILFISIGIALISRFHWILYVFGVILVYTGISMFAAREKGEPDLEKNRIYKWMKKVLPLSTSDAGGKFTLVENGKKYYSSIFVVVVLVATTDVIFAIDSIPAVFGISQEKLVVYTSNIFAVLGLRSLFFLLRGAVEKFRYLQEGIAAVLIFIGLKMLVEILNVHISIYVALSVIVTFITGAILFSIYDKRRKPDKLKP
jgi:tellurite resistance protein TerC